MQILNIGLAIFYRPNFMKKTAGLFLVFAFVLSLPVIKLHAQKPFEGTLTWTMSMPSTKQEKFDITMHIKGDKNETDIDMGTLGGAKEYSDRATQKMYMVMTATNTGVVMDMKEFAHTTKS